MYRAVLDLLTLSSGNHDRQIDDVSQLREKTADYIRDRREDFLPFLLQVGACFFFLLCFFGAFFGAFLLINQACIERQILKGDADRRSSNRQS